MRDRRAGPVGSFVESDEVDESTGIYWKSPYAALEAVGIRQLWWNARHVIRPRPQDRCGRCHWLKDAGARQGLLRASFVPPAALREFVPDCPSATETGWPTGLWGRTGCTKC